MMRMEYNTNEEWLLFAIIAGELYSRPSFFGPSSASRIRQEATTN